jgi:seryl-tRNA synthetase
MSSQPKGAKQTVAERRRTTDDVEPIDTADRSVQTTGDSLYINIPNIGRKILKVSADDDLWVEVYDDRLVVRPKEAVSDE